MSEELSPSGRYKLTVTSDGCCEGANNLPDPESWRTARTPFLYATTGRGNSKAREYQEEGVRFCIMRAREGALLADGMRLGKSCQATLAARAFKAKTLIICPSHVVGVWGRPATAPEGPGEIAKWWPEAWRGTGDLTGVALQKDLEGVDWDPKRPGVVCLSTVKPFKAQTLIREVKDEADLSKDEKAELAKARAEIAAFAKKLEHAQVIICHYDIVYAWVDVLELWGVQTLILDEVHVCAGWQSRRSDALKELSTFASRRIGLSGTPVTNLPRNLHNVLDILAENRFGYFFTGERPGCFSRLFCGSFQKTIGIGQDQKVVWDHSGKSNLDKPDGKVAITKEETLHARLKYLMLRRLKKDVDPEIPQKVRQIVDVSIPARQIVHVTEHMLSAGSGELRRCLDLAADGKLRSVVDLVAAHVLEGEKIICFCYRRRFAESVADELMTAPRYATARATDLKVEFVHGGLTQKERDKRIHALRKHKGPGVLACTIDTTSTGIDLSFASVAVVGELTWEPHELVQLEERLYEFGKKNKSLIQYVIARGTGDELILRAIISKLDSFEKLIGETGDQMKEELTTKKEDPLKRLYKALAAMQKAGTAPAPDDSDEDEPPKPKKKSKGKASSKEASP